MYRAERFQFSESLFDRATGIDGNAASYPVATSPPLLQTTSTNELQQATDNNDSAAQDGSLAVTLPFNTETKSWGTRFVDADVEDAFASYCWCQRSRIAIGCGVGAAVSIAYPLFWQEAGTWMSLVHYAAVGCFLVAFIIDFFLQLLDRRQGKTQEDQDQLDPSRFIHRCKRTERFCLLLLFISIFDNLFTHYGSLNHCARRGSVTTSVLITCYRGNVSLFWADAVLIPFLAVRTRFIAAAFMWCFVCFVAGRFVDSPMMDSSSEFWAKLGMIAAFSASMILLQMFRERNRRHFFLVEVVVVYTSRNALREHKHITNVVATMLPPQVLHRIGTHREELFHNDTRNIASVLQFDVVNFTSGAPSVHPLRLLWL